MKENQTAIESANRIVDEILNMSVSGGYKAEYQLTDIEKPHKAEIIDILEDLEYTVNSEGDLLKISWYRW